jgi:ElaB/YqjD/DUF883 family membrane-anchored ribosome-binding protein
MSANFAPAIAGESLGRPKETVGAPFEELFEGVDDLIRRVADFENPEIRKIRARVHAAMVAAKGAAAANGVAAANGAAAANGVATANGVAGKGAFEGGAKPVRTQAAQIADRADDYLRDYPGQALGVALLVGLGVGLIVSSRQ